MYMRLVIEACKMFEAGINPTDIGKSLGRSRRTIANWLTTQGYQVPHESEDMDEEIEALYERGLDAVDICKRLGISHQALARRAKELGLKIKVHGPITQKDRPRCTICGLPSLVTPCLECEEIEKLGHLPINAELPVLLEFICAVWGEDEARDILEHIWNSDYGVAMAEDSLRGTGTLLGAIVA